MRSWDVGWDARRQGFTLPVFGADDELVNVTWRAPKGAVLRMRGERKVCRLPGRTVANGCLPLYPDLPAGESLLLVEGEWDALVARQAGLPAMTGLLGMRWMSAWDVFVVGRRVAVAYDVGGEAAAEATVERLIAAGASAAWVVRLGLPNQGDDVCDWFTTYARSATALRRLIRESRP
jgi:hypothetical protein